MSNTMFGKLEATQFYFLTFLVLWTSLFTIICFYLITRDYKQICTEETVSPYKPHRLLANLSCGKLMEGGSASYSPISFEDPSQLAMNCKAIRRRRNFVEKTYEEEEDFPLAFDYTWLEMELSTHYSPNNFYCFVIDSKASEVFKTRLRSLANCFENVIVAAEEFDMSSMGRNIVIAQYHGLRLLMNTRKEWKYVFLLENHDILIKTNYELTQILRAYDGANDVHAVSVKRLARWRREQLKNYTFDELGLFRDATEKSLNNVLVNVKGYNQAVLTFDAVDYIFAKLNITTMLEKFNGDGHEEEFFTSSLNANDAIGLPGGFTTKCLKKISFQSMVRYYQRLPRLLSRLLAPALSGSGSEPGARAGNFGVGSGSRAQSRSQGSQRSEK
ncbi:unnamed protein product [Bursaphelenchus xylophilus]|uniref:(pine wood nematode) hypothetical protein n=1 Tax=Bursaphelenchus xylophilus TaxID=6326 RepID=A0A811KUX4_BURXY|nr:unnamed protein product [Bursaphelenchus xylophilus]CAG9104102.1 unnamed protein product [Bursaphelenchus xylophilus]